MLDRIFENPRVHSDKGYKEKEKKKETRMEYNIVTEHFGTNFKI